MTNWLLFDTYDEAKQAEQKILSNLNANWHNKAKGYSIISQLDNKLFGFPKPGNDYPANNIKDVICKEELLYTNDWFTKTLSIFA
jgi:hypothetical protein